MPNRALPRRIVAVSWPGWSRWPPCCWRCLGSAFAQDPEDTPPSIANPTFTPNTVPYTGGEVDIVADVTDDVGVTAVYADVFTSGGDGQSVQLFASATPPAYSGSVVMGPNFSDSPVSYSVVLQATDSQRRHDDRKAGEITVDAQPEFDEPPIVSDPSVTPRTLGSGGGP